MQTLMMMIMLLMMMRAYWPWPGRRVAPAPTLRFTRSKTARGSGNLGGAGASSV
jgi:hypothetical protein